MVKHEVSKFWTEGVHSMAADLLASQRCVKGLGVWLQYSGVVTQQQRRTPRQLAAVPVCHYIGMVRYGSCLRSSHPTVAPAESRAAPHGFLPLKSHILMPLIRPRYLFQGTENQMDPL